MSSRRRMTDMPEALVSLTELKTSFTAVPFEPGK